MAEPWFDDAEQDAIHEAAADWLTRLQNADLSVDDTIAWQSWMTADEKHAQAFRRIEDAWNRFADLPRPALLGSEEIAADTYDGSQTISAWRNEPRAASIPRRSVAPRWLALAASVAALAIGATATMYFQRPSTSTAAQIIETGIGENRSVQLADGSRIDIGGYSRVEVDLAAHERHIVLVRGEAYFSVAKDPERPFSVSAGSATVTALGTQFNVRRAEDRVVVDVVEGRVRVAPRVPLIEQLSAMGAPASSRRRPHQLQAGNQSIVDATGLEVLNSRSDTAAAIAWQQGWLHFDREPLRYVLDSVNRYASKPIELGDERLGDLRITGAASSDNIDGWVSSLSSAFGLAVEEEPGRVVIRSATE